MINCLINMQILKSKGSWIGEGVTRLLEGLLEAFNIYMKILGLKLFIVISKLATYCWTEI